MRPNQAKTVSLFGIYHMITMISICTSTKSTACNELEVSWERSSLPPLSLSLSLSLALTRGAEVEGLGEAGDQQLDDLRSVQVQLLGGAGRCQATNASLPVHMLLYIYSQKNGNKQ